MRVEDKKVVTIDYTLRDPQGTVIDTSEGNEPMPYLHGASNIIPGLEKQLAGKQAGDSVKAVIEPNDAYGPRNDEAVQDVPRSQFPPNIDIQQGMQFQANTPQGPRLVTEIGVTDENVKIDANHPLAGVTLHFDVKIVGVRDATAEEIQHGHVHGPGGHHHH